MDQSSYILWSRFNPILGCNLYCIRHLGEGNYLPNRITKKIRSPAIYILLIDNCWLLNTTGANINFNDS